MLKYRLLNIPIRKFFDIFSCIILSVIVLFTLLEYDTSLTIINNNLNDTLLTSIQSSDTKLEFSKILDSFINNNNKEFALYVYAETDTIQSLSHGTKNPVSSFNKINTDKTFFSTNTSFSSSENSPIILNSTMKKVSQANQKIFFSTPSVLSLNPSKEEFSTGINQETQQQQLQQENKQYINQYPVKDDKIQSDKQRIKEYEKLFISELFKIDYKLAKQIKDDIEATLGSITKLCKMIVNENLSKDQSEHILNNILFDRLNNSEYSTRHLQYPRELLQYQHSNNYFNNNINNDLYSNLVNKYKSSYNNNYNNIDNHPNYQENRGSDIVSKEYNNNDDSNKNNIKYQYYKNYNNNKYNNNEKVTNNFIKNILKNMFDRMVYVVWTDNTSGNSDIFFSSSIDNGHSFSNPINISNNIGESFNPLMSLVEDKIYVVWTDNTSGNSDIFFSSSIDNGHSFSNPINISNNIGESTQLQIITR